MKNGNKLPAKRRSPKNERTGILNCRNFHTSKSLPADRLGISSMAGILVLVLAISALFFLFLDSNFRSAAEHEECLELVRALGLNSLSLVPSGRPLRNPGTNDLSIDLRFDPKLGQIPLDGADLVLKVSD
jgi:hypothetical protein